MADLEAAQRVEPGDGGIARELAAARRVAKQVRPGLVEECTAIAALYEFQPCVHFCPSLHAPASCNSSGFEWSARLE